MLEASLYPGNTAFVTLTYDEDNLPAGGTLVPKHLTDFLKRIRFAQDKLGRRLRYYAVGEYGDDSERPHYHLALFGIPSCRYIRTRHSQRLHKTKAGIYCCDACSAIQRHWPYGGADVGTLERASASYICGYVTKKLTDTNDFRLGGRHPEFARMSRHGGGLGAGAIPDIADRLLRLPPAFLAAMPDVPRALRHGGKPYPLGRYLTRLLRKQIGRSPDAPEINLDAKKAEVQLLRQYAETHSGLLTFSQVYKSICLEVNAPAYERMVYKSNLKKRKRSY